MSIDSNFYPNKRFMPLITHLFLYLSLIFETIIMGLISDSMRFMPSILIVGRIARCVHNTNTVIICNSRRVVGRHSREEPAE